ncbi:hypothetical protein DH2020_015594 [Rehmannia glutinosa]|uniref:Zinc-finger domain-containing protein n=1 Tax=Rehmannia glutinosa TaxID=99300 RepID=A0ABR0WT37_REHGL
MKSLGLFDLSKNLKGRSAKPSSSQRKVKPASTPSDVPTRRSSRLKDVPRVSYSEKKTPKESKSSVENVEIHIEEGEKPEIYTEAHEKLLGDSKAVWELLVDGYDEDGQRIYDPIEGKTCHQCRYGENVIEVNQNPEWVCPVCRGICNCSRCRRDKGWMPTGSIYRRVVKLGFKSVAHYLIYTRREQAIEVGAADNPISADGSLSIHDGKEELTDAISTSPLGGKENEIKDIEMKVDSDEEYIDDYEDEDGDSENASQ